MQAHRTNAENHFTMTDTGKTLFWITVGIYFYYASKALYEKLRFRLWLKKDNKKLIRRDDIL